MFEVPLSNVHVNEYDFAVGLQSRNNETIIKGTLLQQQQQPPLFS